MTSALRISEAVSLAFHTMALLAADPERRHSVKELAGTLSVSEAHLAKVMQRLARQGFVESARGPGGGFMLGADAGEATLLELFESIEGPFEPSNCLLAGTFCGRRECIFGELVKTVNEKLLGYLGETRLMELANTYGE